MIKFKFAATLLIILITLNITTRVYSQNKDRGLWVWSNTDSIIDDYISHDPIDTTWESFLSFCEAPHGNSSDRITNIYMSAYSYMFFNEKKMRSFLSDMNSRGYEVFVVLADPIFAVPDYVDPVRGRVRTDFEAMIDNIIEYQEKVEPAERFAGIMLDIEPHLAPGMPWKRKNRYIASNFTATWETYLNDLSYCKTKIDTYNASNNPAMTFSDAVASWYDEDDKDRDRDGTNEILMDDIMPLVSFYTVQSYSDTASVVLAISAGEVAKAQQQGIECVIGVEVMPLEDEEVTFWEEGHNELETALDSIYDPANSSSTYFSNDAFGGFFIHSYANNANSEFGYQNLTPVITDHAPVIAITYPNGIEADGISFSDDFSVNWEVQKKDSGKDYDVLMYYKFETDLDNESVPWTLFDNDTIPSTTTSSSSMFDITGLATNPGDRIFIKAQISYHTGDPLTTYDITNFGIGIREIPDMHQWSGAIPIDQEDYAQGLKTIIDNEGVIHAVYYYFYYAPLTPTVVTPGIYYSRSSDNGVTWSTTLLTPDPSYGTDSKSKWPRKHCFSKKGNFLAVAWIEHYDENQSTEFDMRVSKNYQNNKGIYIIFSDDNGLTWQGTGGSASKSLAHNQTGWGQCNFPKLDVASNGDVYLVFSQIRQTPSWGTIISYIPFTYSGANWTAGSTVEIKSAGFSPTLSTPDVCKAINGKLVFVWGEVTVDSGITTSMTIKSNVFFGTWRGEKTVFSRTYASDQKLSGAAAEFANYPVFLPNIIERNQTAFVVWQDTEVGSAGGWDLEDSSKVYFAKRDISLGTTSWIVDYTNGVADGFAPSIASYDNEGTDLLQVVYSANFSQYDTYTYTGNLEYIESFNDGDTWSSSASIFTSGSGTSTGIRRPYLNSVARVSQYASMPFIFTDNGNISATCWINGTAADYARMRGTLFLNPSEPPFADLSDNDGFALKWTPPDTSYAPTAYSLRRIPDNNESQAYNLNSGNPIHALHFYDNDGILPNVHYRYELRYHVNGVSSPWSPLSNVVRDESYLLLDDFELKNGTETYTGNEYYLFDVNKPIAAQIVSAQSVSGSYSLEITYTDDDPEDPKGAVVSIIFPSVMDFSTYGSIGLQVRFKPGSGMVEREVLLTVEEETSQERFTIGDPIMLVDDGQWHDYNFFLDQVTPEIPGTTIDLNDIRKLSFVTWGNGSTSYYVDDIKLNGKLGGAPILNISPAWITATNNTGNPGIVFGHVINDDLSPVMVEFGNAPDPWSIRIYTLPTVYNNSEQEFIVKKDGIIRYDADNDTYYPRFNLPVKVWCKNYGPEGFFYPNGDIVNPYYASKGYPSIDNDYFLNGYDFDNDGEIYGFVPSGEAPFIEGSNEGEYYFDLDGDGFKEDDDYFDLEDNRASISEEPVWKFVPVLKHDTVEMDNDAVVMDLNDETTWRILTDSYQGAGEHVLELYFAVFVGEEQILYKDYVNAYGNYTGVIVIDIVYN